MNKIGDLDTDVLAEAAGAGAALGILFNTAIDTGSELSSLNSAAPHAAQEPMEL